MKNLLLASVILTTMLSANAQQAQKEKITKVASCNIKAMDRKISIFKNSKNEYGVQDNLNDVKEITSIDKPAVIPQKDLDEDMIAVIKYAGVDPKNVKQVNVFNLASPADGDGRMLIQIFEKNKKQTSILVTMGVTVCDKK